MYFSSTQKHAGEGFIFLVRRPRNGFSSQDKYKIILPKEYHEIDTAILKKFMHIFEP